MREVQGRIVVITGAAAGMGRLWAERFARDGARLALWDMNAAALEPTAEALRATGAEVLTDAVNVADREAVHRAAARVVKEMGDADVLVNNAGIVQAAPFHELDEARVQTTIDVNLTSMFWTIKAFLPAMRDRNRGHIVNVSSASGFIGVPRMPAYAASKWGVIGLTESLRLELKMDGLDGIRFTLVCPSYVDTGMFAGARPPLLTRMLTPEGMVDKAYRAFKADQYFVREPWMVKITPALKGLLPTALFDVVSDVLGVNSSVKDWKGHGRD